jgi:hypothetical protein
MGALAAPPADEIHVCARRARGREQLKAGDKEPPGAVLTFGA